jgi:hypothetical protein
LTTSFSSPDLVGALDVTANKGSLNSVGRTFVGVRDDDADGNFETMLVYSSGAATQPQAASVLTASGAQQQAMLDGSGSTFLVVDGVTRIPTDGRLVPQAIAFYGSY